jgi:hypothetical protein
LHTFFFFANNALKLLHCKALLAVMYNRRRTFVLRLWVVVVVYWDDNCDDDYNNVDFTPPARRAGPFSCTSLLRHSDEITK